MSEREKVLASVRRALSPLPERAAMPFYDSDMVVLHKTVDGRDVVELLAERMKRVNGATHTSVAQVVAFLRQGGWMRGYCDPVVWPQLAGAFGPEFLVETEFDRTRID